MCSFFMTGYSAIAFKTEFLRNSYFDSDKDPRKLHDEGYTRTVDDLRQGKCKVVDDSLLKVFRRVLETPAQLKQSFLQNFVSCYCQNKKTRILRNRMMENLSKSLDIRGFIKTHIDLRLLIKRTLTRQ